MAMGFLLMQGRLTAYKAWPFHAAYAPAEYILSIFGAPTALEQRLLKAPFTLLLAELQAVLASMERYRPLFPLRQSTTDAYGVVPR